MSRAQYRKERKKRLYFATILCTCDGSYTVELTGDNSERSFLEWPGGRKETKFKVNMDLVPCPRRSPGSDFPHSMIAMTVLEKEELESYLDDFP